MTIRVLLAGGTGLVGSLVRECLSRRDNVDLVSLVRNPSGPEDRVVDFEELVVDPAGTLGADRVDIGISCLGTTMRKAGSEAAFRRVDHDYVVGLAEAVRRQGARQFILVSSVGAGGRGFYLRVKGETEAALRGLGFQRLDLIRPGLILGDRPDRRVGERLAQIALPVLGPLLRGGLDRYAAIPAAHVADAIIDRIGAPAAGVFVAHNREIRRDDGSAAALERS